MTFAQALTRQQPAVQGRSPILDIQDDIQRLKNYNKRMERQQAIEAMAMERRRRQVIARANQKLAGVMHAVLGGLASITETYIVDFYERLKREPQLYRHSVKKDMNTARKTVRKLIRVFYGFQQAVNTQTLWCDLTDIMEDELKPELMRLRLCTLQALRHQHVERDEMMTDAMIAYNFANMLNTFLRDFDVLAERYFHMQVNPQICTDIAVPIRSLLESIYRVTEGLGLGKVNFTEDEYRLMQTGYKAIERRFEDFEWVERMCHMSLELNGIITKENEENDISNNYTPWNDVQKGVLIHYYHRDGAEGVASMLHRSQGAVQRMYYRLKATERYEEL